MGCRKRHHNGSFSQMCATHDSNCPGCVSSNQAAAAVTLGGPSHGRRFRRVGFEFRELTPEEIQAVMEDENRIQTMFMANSIAAELALARYYASQQLYLDEVAILDRIVTEGYPDHIDLRALLELRNALRSAGFEYGAATYYEDVIRVLAPNGIENVDPGTAELLDDILSQDSRTFRISGDLELAGDVEAQRALLSLPGSQ